MPYDGLGNRRLQVSVPAEQVKKVIVLLTG